MIELNKHHIPCHMYISVDDVTRIIARMGRGALLGKLDIKIACYIVIVHPEDQLLLENN